MENLNDMHVVQNNYKKKKKNIKKHRSSRGNVLLNQNKNKNKTFDVIKINLTT